MALLVEEVFHKIRTKPTSRKYFFAIKFDMQNAYDKLDWNFLKQVLEKFGFHKK